MGMMTFQAFLIHAIDITIFSQDIQYWYSNGPGQPTSAAQGIGYVQELVSRLTKTRITSFKSSVNSTVVSSEDLFPLDQSIYVDATHDTTLTSSEYSSLFSLKTRNLKKW